MTPLNNSEQAKRAPGVYEEGKKRRERERKNEGA